jgi:hypothetical protein
MDQMIRFSGKHDPEIWNPCGQIRVAGLGLRLVHNCHAVDFYRGGRKVRIGMFTVVTLGQKWVVRKLIRFRRYAKRMERIG